MANRKRKKKFFKNRPWKKWRTRKASFIIVSLFWSFYAIAGLFNFETNSQITEHVFSAGKWILTFGIVLVISDKAGESLINLFSVRNQNEEVNYDHEI